MYDTGFSHCKLPVSARPQTALTEMSYKKRDINKQTEQVLQVKTDFEVQDVDKREVVERQRLYDVSLNWRHRRHLRLHAHTLPVHP